MLVGELFLKSYKASAVSSLSLLSCSGFVRAINENSFDNSDGFTQPVDGKYKSQQTRFASSN